METFSNPPPGFRKPKPSEIHWGATIWQTCKETTRSITLHQTTIEKFTLRTLGAKVGMNAADHDRHVKETNDEMIRVCRKMQSMGHYWVSDNNE